MFLVYKPKVHYHIAMILCFYFHNTQYHISILWPHSNIRIFRQRRSEWSSPFGCIACS